jgi:hypothetical protein
VAGQAHPAGDVDFVQQDVAGITQQGYRHPWVCPYVNRAGNALARD